MSGVNAVVLALDLVLYDAAPALVERVTDYLTETTPDSSRRAFWAHGLLRLVDWRLRHSPDDDLSWLPRAEKLADI